MNFFTHRKRFSILLLLLLLDLQAMAQQRKFLMWKVTSPTATVYLVGSIHLADPQIFPLPAPVERAFAESNVLAVEADVSNINIEQAVGLVGEYGLYTDGDSLSKHLSPATSSALDSFCSKHGLPREMLETMKPWMVALMAEAAAAQQSGFDAASGIDMHFLGEVKPNQRIDQLESVEFQFKLLGSASDEEQQQFLDSALKTSDEIDQTERAYVSGDVNALAHEISKQEPRSYYQRLLEDRNPAMTGKVAAYLGGNETVFVVVGIAHVIGDRGIAKSLERKHYKVEQRDFTW
jgi:uncharacterized protein YbaP (TraB family)